MLRIARVMAVMVDCHHHIVHMVMMSRLLDVDMLRERHVSEMRKPAFQGDGRERLNRKAQCQQHDEEEFAPVRHRCEV